MTGQETPMTLFLVVAAIVVVFLIYLKTPSSNRKVKTLPTSFDRKPNNLSTSTERTQGYQAAKVDHVIDGDTVIVSTSWRKIRIRLDSIDCPEDGQDWGDIAKYGLIKLIGGRKIQFEEHCQDQYGRTVATIYVQNGRNTEWMNVNARMVTLGHAWVMRRFYDHLPKERRTELNRLEKWAKTKKVGLWKSPNPVPPWQWRGDAR